MAWVWMIAGFSYGFFAMSPSSRADLIAPGPFPRRWPGGSAKKAALDYFSETGADRSTDPSLFTASTVTVRFALTAERGASNE
jgi:hypothetical protein